MAEMLLAATSGAEQIYFIIDPKDSTQDGVVVTETNVRHVPFWSYVSRTQVQPIKTSSFLQGLWDMNGPQSPDWMDAYQSRTEPFSEEVIKQIKPFLVEVPAQKEPKATDDGLSARVATKDDSLEVKAKRVPLRQEPYDPDARDGDNDGIIQEGTPWERPAATRFLTSAGEEFAQGFTATDRPAGRIVDADGNDVDYKPTYERAETGTIGVGRQIGQLERQPKPEQPKPKQPAAAEPGKEPAEKPGKPKVGTPLADHGAGSLKEQGLQSVRQTAAPQPPPAPKPPATEAPAAPVRIDPEIVDRANIPYRPGVGADGEPLVYKRDPNDGGPSFEVSVDDKVREILKDIDKFIEDNPDNEEIKRIREELDSEVPDKFERQVKQEVVDRGLNDVIEAYSKPGKSVYVTLPDDKAVEVLRSGRIKTIHETGTSQGQKDPKVRVEVEEARLGVPKNLSAERRPVYGWIRPIKSADGTEEEGALNTEIYGRIHLRLKKGVRSRSTMTLGDTINDKRTGVPLTPEQRTEIVWGQYGRAVESGGPAAAMTTPDRIRGQMARAAISKSHGDEARSRVHARFLEEYPALRAAIGDAPDFTSTGWGRGFAHYTEVQVHGGVDIEDVEAIEVPEGLPEETLAELKRLADERGIKVEVQESKTKPLPTRTTVKPAEDFSAKASGPAEEISDEEFRRKTLEYQTKLAGDPDERTGIWKLWSNLKLKVKGGGTVTVDRLELADDEKSDDAIGDAAIAKVVAAHLVATRMRELGYSPSSIFKDEQDLWITREGRLHPLPSSSGNDMSDLGYTLIDPSDPNYQDLLDESAVSLIISSWTIGSSMIGTPLQRALQDAAAQSFGLDQEMLVTEGDEITDEMKQALQGFIEASYSRTQEALEGMDIKEVMVHRGFSVDLADVGLDDARDPKTIEGVAARHYLLGENDISIPVTLRALSSFSTDKETADDFSTAETDQGASITISAVIPSERIVTFPGAGLGCLGESEFVIRGSKDGESDMFRAEFDIPRKLEGRNGELSDPLAASRLIEPEMYSSEPEFNAEAYYNTLSPAVQRIIDSAETPRERMSTLRELWEEDML
jgi:hypothetical protein